MNNWLGFSLSPQEIPSGEPNQTISGSPANDCFGLPADDSSSVAQQETLSIQNNASYSILDTLNGPNNNCSPQGNHRSLSFFVEIFKYLWNMAPVEVRSVEF